MYGHQNDVNCKFYAPTMQYLGPTSLGEDARLLYTLELQKHNNAKSDNGELILFGIPFFTDNFTTFVSLCCEDSFEVSFPVPSY